MSVGMGMLPRTFQTGPSGMEGPLGRTVPSFGGAMLGAAAGPVHASTPGAGGMRTMLHAGPAMGVHGHIGAASRAGAPEVRTGSPPAGQAELTFDQILDVLPPLALEHLEEALMVSYCISI